MDQPSCVSGRRTRRWAATSCRRVERTEYQEKLKRFARPNSRPKLMVRIYRYARRQSRCLYACRVMLVVVPTKSTNDDRRKTPRIRGTQKIGSANGNRTRISTLKG